MDEFLNELKMLLSKHGYTLIKIEGGPYDSTVPTWYSSIILSRKNPLMTEEEYRLSGSLVAVFDNDFNSDIYQD